MAAITQQQIDELRNSFEAKLQQEGPPSEVGSFHPHDLERLKEDNYVKRFLEHVDGDMKQALFMVWDTFVWRKSFGANEITEDNLPMDFLRDGSFFTRGRDISGKALLIFKCVKYKKGAYDMDSLKRCIVYWFDRMERSEKNSQITVFFDMEGAGLSNMDMEVIKYLIGILKLYYPNFLNFIVIYEMAWVLNAAFKVIKSLLPAKAVAKMKFLTKANIKDVVPLDQALKCWGGQDDYEFKFESETVDASANDNSVKKVVTFAEAEQVISDSSDCRNSNMIVLNPPTHIIFGKTGNDITSTFSITNNDLALITYKIKTTSPEKFRVRPNSGTLASGISQTINVTIQQGYQTPPTFGNDKFLVMCMSMPANEMGAQDLAELWKNAATESMELHKLRCTYQSTELAKNGIMRQNSLSDSDKQLSQMSQSSQISQSLSDLNEAHQQMRKEIKTLKYITMLTFSMTFVIISVMCYLYQARGSAGSSIME